MPLHTLKREYEERRQALLDQLDKKRLDSATKHQLFGAIKEIENFLKAIEYQMEKSQDAPDLDLASDRPRPLVERTKSIAGRVRSSTRKVVTEHIPSIAGKVAAGPKRAMERARRKRALKRQIQKELRARLQHDAAAHGDLPSGIHTDVRTNDDRFGPLPPKLEAETSSTSGQLPDDLSGDESRSEIPKKQPTGRVLSEKKSARKRSKKQAGYVATKSGTSYHRTDCSTIKNKKNLREFGNKRAAAGAGLSACSFCMD